MDAMKLSEKEIQEIQRTFEMIVPMEDTFALIFYDRFFELEPAVRPLFQVDMALQREKLMSMMSLIVRGLDKPETFIPELREMGLRHASYRVEPKHYNILNEAVIMALEESLGESVNEEMRAAWRKTLAFVSSIMLDGAADPQPVLAD